MARHTITEKDLDEWLRTPQWQAVASSLDRHSNKSLEVDVSPDGPVFRVVSHNETLFIGMDKITAVDIYNKAP